MLTDKTILIAGGVTGLGSALALAAAGNGSQVVLCDFPHHEMAIQNVLKIAQEQAVADKISFIPADFANENEIERIFEVLFDRKVDIQVLINNMEGVITKSTKSLLTISLSEWDHTLHQSLRRAFWLSKYAVNEFLSSSEICRILHILCEENSSPVVQSGMYAFIRSLAKEYGRRHITTNMLLSDVEYDSSAASLPDPVIQTALFMVSDQASFINGERIHVSRKENTQKTMASEALL